VGTAERAAHRGAGGGAASTPALSTPEREGGGVSETTDRKTLRLIESKTVGDGIVILIHAPARPASSSKAVS
jgi:hypothetical protein